jgi:peptidoglycan/xylan/chitin deacetylase (PgdA/CDA1 family)
MTQVAEHLQAHRPLPPRAVAITFDDGFASVGSSAAPILARYGLTATVYVISGMIGRLTHWTAYGATLPALPLLDWPGIKMLQDQGIEIGAHTVTHGFLTQYRPAALARELQEPRAVLERELGPPVRAFAYPQGDYNAAVVAAVRAAGYTSATTLDQGRAGRRADPLRLPRLHVGPNTTPTVLRAFTVPTVGPTYQLINLAIRGVLGRKTWPRPNPAHIDSTQTLPLPEHS